MSDDAEQDGLRWEDGAPISTRFGDPYYARADGLAETRHVFLAGSGLPERWRDRSAFHIAELGFGTGLSFCAALRLWRQTARPGARLRFTSFEAYPLPRAAMARALAAWPELEAEADALLAAQPAERLDLEDATLELVLGDARATLPQWRGRADAWFLDGFAPARNPELWEPALMAQVAAHTAPGGTFATYSAAGAVRRSLAAAGFAVEKRKGYGRKREMCVGRLTGPASP